MFYVRLLYLLVPHSFEKVKTKFVQVAIFLSLLKAVVEKNKTVQGLVSVPSAHITGLLSHQTVFITAFWLLPLKKHSLKKKSF